MAKISNQEAYPLISSLSGSDYLILTDADSDPIDKQTKTVTVAQLAAFITQGGSPFCGPEIVLQNVGTCGNPYHSNVFVNSLNYADQVTTDGTTDQIGIYNNTRKSTHTPGAAAPNDFFYGQYNQIQYTGSDPVNELYGTYSLMETTVGADVAVGAGILGTLSEAVVRQTGQKSIQRAIAAVNNTKISSQDYSGIISFVMGTLSQIDIDSPQAQLSSVYGHYVDFNFSNSNVTDGVGIKIETGLNGVNDIDKFTYIQTKDTTAVATDTKFIESTLDVPSELAGHLQAKSLTLTDCPIFADNVAATLGGLTAGDVYQTDGTAENPLNVPGILMIVQPDIQPTEYTVVLSLTNSIIDNNAGAPNYQLDGAEDGTTVVGPAGTSYEFVTTALADQGFEFNPAFNSTNPSGLIPVGGTTVFGELTGTVVPLQPNEYVVTMTPLNNNIVDLNPNAPNYTITGNLQGDSITDIQGNSYAFSTTVTPNPGYRFDPNNPFNATNPSGIIPGNNLDVPQTLTGTIIPDPDVTVTMTPLINNIIDNEPGGPHYVLTDDLDGAQQSGQPLVGTYAFTTTVSVNPGYAFDPSAPFTATNPSGTFSTVNETVTQTVSGTIIAAPDTTVTMTPLTNNIIDNNPGAPNYTLTGNQDGDQLQGQPLVEQYAFNTGIQVNPGFEIDPSDPFTATNPSGTFQLTNIDVEQKVGGTIVPVAQYTVTMTPLTNNITDNTPGAPNYTLSDDLDGATVVGPQGTSYSFTTVATPNAGFQFNPSDPFTATNPSGTIPGNNLDVPQILGGEIIANPDDDPYVPVEGADPFYITVTLQGGTNPKTVAAFDENINLLNPPTFAAPIWPNNQWSMSIASDNYEVIVIAGTSNPQQLYISNDSGASWFAPTNAFGSRGRVYMSKSGQTIISGVSNTSGTGALFISNDFGATFNNRSSLIESLFGDGSQISTIRFANCSGSGKYIYVSALSQTNKRVVGRSDDYGASFTDISSSIPGTNEFLGDIFVSGTGARVAFMGRPVTFNGMKNSFSTDYGVTWTESTFQGDVKTSGRTEGSYNGLIIGASELNSLPQISYDGGDNWVQAPDITNTATEFMYVSNAGDMLSIVTPTTNPNADFNVWLSKDSGVSFTVTEVDNTTKLINNNFVLIDKS